MKLRGQVTFAFRAMVAFAGLAALAIAPGCSKHDPDEKPATDAAKPDAEPKVGVTLDAETQGRIGLKLETPAPAQWQPETDAVGRVTDPLAFMAAAADLETARSAAAVSQADLDRTRKLAEQDNASARMLETAQALAARDALALIGARAKFAAEWGGRLAGQTNLVALGTSLGSNDFAYVKVTLPVGMFPNPLPATARIFVLGNETNAVEAELADDLRVDPATQTQTLLYSVTQKLPAGLAVRAELQTAGDPVTGVLVPADAVLRHLGLGWVYVQTDTNQFARAEVPLNHFMTGGWFVPEGLTSTNRIVVVGAQTVLSAELSGGGFSTGGRD